MPESSALSSATSTLTRYKGRTLWHVTVGAKMPRWFDRAEMPSKEPKASSRKESKARRAAKGVEGKGRRETVWRLRGTAMVQ